MGSNDKVTQMWRLRASSDVNPGFVRSVVAIQMEQLRRGLQETLGNPDQQNPANQEFIRSLMTAIPEVRTIMVNALELAVLGRACSQTHALSAPQETYMLPPNSRELAQRIDAAQKNAVGQLALLELPDVADDLRTAVRETFTENIFPAVAEAVMLSAADNLGFSGGHSGHSPR